MEIMRVDAHKGRSCGIWGHIVTLMASIRLGRTTTASIAAGKIEHKTEATWGNRLGGNMFWLSAKRVAVEQQDHPTWKGKAAPKA